MKKNLSKVDIYDVVVSAFVKYKADNKTQKKLETPLPLTKIAECFNTLNDKSIVIGKYSLQDFCYSPQKKTMILLINRNDPDAKNPIFRDTKTNKRRSGDKKDTEGIDYSCHVVINLNGFKNRYTMAIEKSIPGVPVTNIRSFVNQLIKICSQHFEKEFQTNHPSGIRDKKGVYIKLPLNHEVEFSGHVSDSFIKDIQTSTICEFELIDTNPDTSYENIGAKEKSNIIELEVIGKKIPRNSTAKGFLSNIFKKYGTKYDLAKLKFTTIENADKIIRLNTDSFTINGREYIKSYFVKAPINQDTSYDKIQILMTDEMLKLIK